MNNTRSIWHFSRWLCTVLYILAAAFAVNGQVLKQCNCLTCVDTIQDNTKLLINFEIKGALDSNLANSTQGLCKVSLKFTHEFLSDVTIKLKSPAGQEVTLVGPYFNNNSALLTKGTRWDITFVDTFAVAVPDSTFAKRWKNDQPWSIFSQYYGSYYPFAGNLNDFNTGSVNGTWVLTVEDNGPDQIPKSGLLEYVQLSFCSDAGLNCNVCRADAGTLNGLTTLNYCEGDSALLVTINPKFENGRPNPLNYGQYLLVSKDSTIVALQRSKLADLRTYPPGKYSINTLSFVKSDSTKINSLAIGLKIKPFKDSIISPTRGLCANFSDSAQTVNIYGTYQRIDTVTKCFGETHPVGVNNHDQSGLYRDTLQSQYGCDSIIVTKLTILSKRDTFIRKEICKNGKYFVGNLSFNKAGLYNIKLKSKNNCDSTVNLLLTVVDTLFTKVTATRCFGDTLTIGNKVFFASGIYKLLLTSQDGCDSIVTLDLTIKPRLITAITRNICQGDSIKIGKSTYFSSGPKVDTLITPLGCDSIVFLNLFVGSERIVYIDTSVCQGSYVEFSGNRYYQTGTYMDTFPVKNGCDSISVLNLEILPFAKHNILKVICQGQTYTFGGKVLAQSGNYSDTIVGGSSSGCDSISNLFLFVKNSFSSNLEVTLCEGESYIIGDSTYFVSGLFLDTLTTKDGCDSVLKIKLNILPKKFYTQKISICNGQKISVGSSIYNLPGTYIDTLSTRFYGCDSVVTTILEISDRFETTYNYERCQGDSVTINQMVFKQTQLYKESYMASAGCDSIIIHDIQFNKSWSDTLYRQICSNQTYTFQSTKITKAGVYTKNFQTPKGCDSTITLVLTVSDTFAVKLDSTICAGQKVTIGSADYTETGFFVNRFVNNEGCDSIINLNLQVLALPVDTIHKTICKGTTIRIGKTDYGASGFYKEVIASSTACDSIVYLDLKVIDTVISQQTSILCTGDSLVFGNQIIKSAGSYVGRYKTSIGCDSIVNLFVTEKPKPKSIIVQAEVCALDSFTFRNKTYKGLGEVVDTVRLSNANGCDTLAFVQLNFVTKLVQNIDTSFCDGSFLSINNINYFTTGFYKITLKTKSGCDSIINLNLTVNPVNNLQIDTTICAKDTLYLGKLKLFNAGTTIFKLKNRYDCDSILTVNLKKTQFFVKESYQEICEGDSVFFGKLICKTSGTYTDTVRSTTSCDSLLILKLLVQFSFSLRLEAQICEGDSVLMRGKYYKENTNTNFFINNPVGCDTTVYIKVTQNAKYYTLVDRSVCAGDSVFYNGGFYKIAGKYVLSSTSIFGCDSTTELHIKTLPTYKNTLNRTICKNESVVLDGKIYNKTGSYTILAQTKAGCDSTLSLNLIVQDYVSQQLTKQLCLGQTYTFGQKIISKSGFYADTVKSLSSCDTARLLDIQFVDTIKFTLDTSICAGSSLPYNSQQLKVAGVYTYAYKSKANCDSIYQIRLKVNPVFSDTIVVTQCQNQNYDFFGTTVTQPGFYQRTFSTTSKCDSVLVLFYKQNPLLTKSIKATICKGSSILLNGKTYTTAGVYQDTAKSKTTCDTLLTIQIETINPTTQNIIYDLCAGDTVRLGSQIIVSDTIFADTLKNVFNCDSILSYKILFKKQSFSSQTITVCENDTLKAGTYKIFYKNQVGCDSVVSLTVIEEKCKVNASIRMQAATCFNKANGKIFLEILDGVAPYEYSWKDLNDNIFTKSILGNKDTLSGLLGGSYNITVTDKNKNVLAKSIFVDAPPPLKVSVASIPQYDGYQFKCTNSQDGYITLAVTGGTAGYSYNWSNGTTTQDLDKIGAGVYSLTITDQQGCVDTSIRVAMQAPPLPNIQTTVTDPRCFGEANGSLKITIDSSKAPFSISFNSGKYDTLTQFNQLKAGSYFVKFTDKFGCNYERQVKLIQPQKLIVDLGPDSTIRLGDKIILTASISLPLNEIDSILWSDGSSCQDCILLDAAPLQNSIYAVKVVNNKGCFATDSVNIFVDQKLQIDIPNAITPNEDGLNDVFILDFLVKNPDAFPKNELSIYNRWGDMVYQSKPYQNNWKGTNQNGDPLPAGTYYYILRLDLNEGNVYQGDVTILR